MPNLQGKIELIKQAKDDIKSAIVAKGVTPAGNISTYADAISRIVSTNNQTKTVTSNGIVRYDEGYTGLEQVTVALPLNNKSITANGTYNASSDNLQGYNSVTVNVQPDVDTKTITANGTYNASSDNLDGYNQVTVNVPSSINNLIDGSITEVDTNVSTIKSSAFKDCESLDTVVLRSNTVVDLSDDSIFENTPIASKEGNIYVPSNLIDTYNFSFNTFTTPIYEPSDIGANAWVNGYQNLIIADNGLIKMVQEIGTDTYSWTTVISSLQSGEIWNAVCYGDSQYIVLSSAGMIAQISYLNLQLSYIPSSRTYLTSGGWIDMAWGEEAGRYVAVSSNYYIAESFDEGSTWFTYSGSGVSVTYHEQQQQFYTITSDGALFKTTNGDQPYNRLIWQRVLNSQGAPVSLGNHNWTRIRYYKNMLFALSANTGYYAFSSDGVVWGIVQDTNIFNQSAYGSFNAIGFRYTYQDDINDLFVITPDAAITYLNENNPPYNILPIP